MSGFLTFFEGTLRINLHGVARKKELPGRTCCQIWQMGDFSPQRPDPRLRRASAPKKEAFSGVALRRVTSRPSLITLTCGVHVIGPWTRSSVSRPDTEWNGVEWSGNPPKRLRCFEKHLLSLAPRSNNV